MFGSKLPPRREQRVSASLALLVLVLTTASSGQAAQASVPTPEAASVRGVASQVGQVAPEFTVTTLDGLPLTSTDLLAQEKPYILYFFASW